MTSLLIGSMTRYGQGYSFLRTRILFSYCIYIFAFSKRGTSLLLSPSPAVLIASRTSVLYSSKGSALNSGDDITSESLMEAGLSIAAGKITSIVPKDGLKLGTPSGEQISQGSCNIPRGYKDARVLLVGDGDLSFAAALSTLKVCRRLVRSQYIRSSSLNSSFLLLRLNDLH